MLRTFIITGFAMIMFFGCALENKGSENAPSPSEETTWTPEM